MCLRDWLWHYRLLRLLLRLLWHYRLLRLQLRLLCRLHPRLLFWLHPHALCTFKPGTRRKRLLLFPLSSTAFLGHRYFENAIMMKLLLPKRWFSKGSLLKCILA
jgi:hypothetical protein